MLPPPYKAKSVEKIRLLSTKERERRLQEADYNLFFVKARHVYIDLLTDSGTNAMSQNQWAAMMQADESYAGSESFERLERAVRSVTDFPHILPVHQGRGAEHILNETVIGNIVDSGMIVPGNKHFDTTLAHIEHAGGVAVDCTISEAYEFENHHPFKGNVDLCKLEEALNCQKGKIAYVLLTVTCNSIGGHPVSLANIRAVRRYTTNAGVPLFLDGARFAENSYLIKMREPGMRKFSPARIARDMCAEADGMLMSAKKDALVNMGGFIALRDPALFEKLMAPGTLYEGFPHYGGMSGRDMEALAVGLTEGLDGKYLEHRISQVAYLGEALARIGVPVVRPFGGHAVYIDAGRMLPHIPWDQFPGQALAIEIYREGGIRTVEIGSSMAGRDPKTHKDRRSRQEFLRLAIPRRVYGQEHLDYVVKVLGKVLVRASSIRGVAFSYEAPDLRHFLSRFRMVG